MPANYIGAGVERVLFPFLSRAAGGGQDDPLEIVVRGVELALTLGGLIGLFILLNAEMIVFLALGPQWGDAIVLLMVLSLSVPWRIAYKLGDSFAKAIGAVKERVARESVVFMFTVAAMAAVVKIDPLMIAAIIPVAALLNFALAVGQAAGTAKAEKWEVWQRVAMAHGTAALWLLPLGGVSIVNEALSVPVMGALASSGVVATLSAAVILIRWQSSENG